MDKIELPVIIPDRLLISPGNWNDNDYSAKELTDAFARTDWNDKTKISLWLNHDDGNASAFAGYVKNPRLLSEGRIFGDLEIWDEKTATILTQAMAKFGVSVKIKGEEDKSGKMHNFSFENFSIVTIPACDEAYINLAKKEKIVSKYLFSKEMDDSVEKNQEEELAEVTGMETERNKRGMSPSTFYAAPRDPPSSSALPIFDKAHAQNAMARFNQTQFKSPEEKAKARGKIIAAANKFGIKVSDKFKSLSNIDEGRLKKMEERLEEKKEMEKLEEKDKKEVEEKDKKEVEKKELSEKELLKELCNKFDKLVELLSKKELAEDEKEVEEAEAPKDEAKEESKEEESKELTEVKRELAETKKKLNAPKSKTIRNLSSNTVGNDVSFSNEKFASLLTELDNPIKII